MKRRQWRPAVLVAFSLSVLALAGAISAPSAGARPAPVATGTATWANLAPAASPPARFGAAAAYDATTDQGVLFGGSNGRQNLDDTWIFDGSTWRQIRPDHSPSARQGAAMAYDQATGQLILFGGLGATGALNDTWNWNGSDWTQVPTSYRPSPRSLAAMAQDPKTGQLVLFGGYGGSGTGELNDTYVWEGDHWDRAASTANPPALQGAAMASDQANGTVLLFGGATRNAVTQETWTFDGTNWTKQTPAQSPSARSFATLAFSPGTGQVVLFGGQGANRQVLGDTWSWTGTTWQQLSPPTSPPARSYAASFSDPRTQQPVVVGGTPGTASPLGDSWLWKDPTRRVWLQLHPADSPTARVVPVMAFDQASGQLLLFGGGAGDAGGAQNDTWNWTGTTWQKLSPVTSPPVLVAPAMAYDDATQQLLLVGGLDLGKGQVADETWNWTGTTWQKLSPANPPGKPVAATMAYDPRSRALVLFSGIRLDGFGAQTWTWDGTTWTRRVGIHDILPRLFPAMAASPSGPVMAGGLIQVTVGYEDTWRWNGTSWDLLTPSTHPPSLAGASMSAVPGTADDLLFGGFPTDGPNPADKTWNFNGTTWNEVKAAGRWPPGRGGAAMAADLATGQVVLFGGQGADYHLQGDTWVYTYGSAASRAGA
jgi:hypothetical protein